MNGPVDPSQHNCPVGWTRYIYEWGEVRACVVGGVSELWKVNGMSERLYNVNRHTVQAAWPHAHKA